MEAETNQSQSDFQVPPAEGSQSESFVHQSVDYLSTSFLTLSWFDFDPVMMTLLGHPVKVAVAAILVVVALLRGRQRRRLPPGPWAWPIVGHLPCLLNNPHFKLSHLRDVYGDVYQLWCGGKRVVVVSSLEGMMEALVTSSPHDVNGRPDFPSYHALYPSSRQQGVCTGDPGGEAYAAKRSFISAAVDVYCSDAPRIEDKLSSEIVDTVNQLSEFEGPFDPTSVLHLACLNVTLNLTFSQRFDPCGRTAQEIWRLYEHRSSAFQFKASDYLPVLRAFTADDHWDSVQQQLSSFQMESFSRLLNLHKDTYDPSSLRDFTDQLLLFLESGEDGSLLSKDDLHYLLLDMAGFGFQAIAVTLTWLLGYMALNPEIQRAVQDELDEVVGRDRLPCLDDQPYLPLTEAVVCEVQRLATVKPFLIPHRNKKTVFIQGYQVPADSVVLFNMWGMHHDPRYWKHPSRFDPYRFLNEDRNLEIPDHFLPYGAGSRRCPGESLAEVQLFLFFASLMHQLRVSPGQPGMTLEAAYDHVLRPQSFLLTVTERDRDDF